MGSRIDISKRQRVLGMSASSLTSALGVDFCPHVRPLAAKLFPLRSLVPYLVKLGSPSFRRMLIDMLPISALREGKEIADTLHEESKSIYESNKRALMGERDVVAPQVGDGKDILSILRGFPSPVYTISKSDCNDDSQGKYGFRGRRSSS